MMKRKHFSDNYTSLSILTWLHFNFCFRR